MRREKSGIEGREISGAEIARYIRVGPASAPRTKGGGRDADQVGLFDLWRDAPSELSGGQRQRVTASLAPLRSRASSSRRAGSRTLGRLDPGADQDLLEDCRARLVLNVICFIAHDIAVVRHISDAWT